MSLENRKILSSLARPLKLVRLIRWSGQNCIFPFYHTVSPEVLPHISHLYRVPDPVKFENDLDQLLNWYEALSLKDYLENPGHGRARPAMVLSFDDGLKGCYDFVAPLLRKKGVPAVFFLNNRFIDNRGLFYRYKASLLINSLRNDFRTRERIAAFLKIPHDQAERSILLIDWGHRALLDALAIEAELDFSAYLQSSPVYMSSDEIKALLRWGFEIGGHSPDHSDFNGLTVQQMARQVTYSNEDLRKRFGVQSAYFSFPFSSDPVPGELIATLLKEGGATALLGTAGLKQTGIRAFIQRIPMEKYGTDAIDTLKAEYLYYLLKIPFGKNRLRQ